MANRPTQTNDPWTIGRLLAWTQEHLQAKQVEDARLSAELLLAKAMDCRRIDLYARFDQEPSTEQKSVFRELVRVAAEHRPIAYLIGHREFYSLDFKVTPDVLIPRPETELLVERALAWCAEHPGERHDVLDVGTGSGCIAIAIAKRRPSVHAVATDVSDAALAVAGENAAKHGVAERVRMVYADLFDLSADAIPEGGFDIVVSNPPYVSEPEYKALPRNVADYEPASALLAGPDGLDIYRRMAADVGHCLRPGGTLILEVGYTQAEAVRDLFTGSAVLELVGCFKDLAGIERALQFVRAC